ncbi:MAG: FAD-dependent thymidylate synthase [Candidatus Heimdallarchaeota archaeon]|nr:MAG: FAD-dependent thymidylate synthase [Candidatus Heimdallarchaeota archaeon]
MEIDLIQMTSTKGIVEGMKTSRHKNHIEDIPKKIFKWGHWSVLEHCSMTVKIRNISRVCTHQLVRHRIGVTYTQESQRYFDPLTDPDWYIIPPRIQKVEELRQRYIEARAKEAEEYRYYREKGIPKEDARFCLPNACKTTVTWTFNMNSLLWFLEQRLKKEAQWEIRLLAKKLYNLVMETEWGEFLKYWEAGSRR